MAWYSLFVLKVPLNTNQPLVGHYEGLQDGNEPCFGNPCWVAIAGSVVSMGKVGWLNELCDCVYCVVSTCVVLTANTYLYVPPRRYVFSGADAYGRLTEEDDDDDDTDSSVVSADSDERLTDDQCSNTDRPVADSPSSPQTPLELANLDSSSGSCDPWLNDFV